MPEEELKLANRCKRCNKPLKSERSQKQGYGRTCFAKVSLEK